MVSQSSSLTTGKIVDHVIRLEPFSLARDIMSYLLGMSFDSVNHVGYEGLRARSIAASIESKTESRTVEEAKVESDVWGAAQVARIKAFARQLAPLGVKEPAVGSDPDPHRCDGPGSF
jgi:hypothetical protein